MNINNNQNTSNSNVFLESRISERKNSVTANLKDEKIQGLKSAIFKAPGENEYLTAWVKPSQLDQSQKKSEGGALTRSTGSRNLKAVLDEDFSSSWLTKPKDVETFRTNLDSPMSDQDLLKQGKNLFHTSINFEMMSFLFDKVLLNNEVLINDLEKCYAGVQYYLIQVVIEI